MSRTIGLVSICIGWLLLASTATAAESPDRDDTFELTADSVEHESARQTYVARGNVRIVSRGTELTADWMVFNESTRRGAATGNVVFRTERDTLFADFIEFNVDSERGILFAAEFDSERNQFRMSGASIAKHSDDSYSFERGRFTTCECPDEGPDPWAIKAESADLEVGGYGTARNTTVEILGVPVVWLPWMIYPLKTERETGLLFPVFGYSGRNGADLGIPFFWAAHESVNVILLPRWLSKRGVKVDSKLEYVFGEESRGEVAAHYIHDQKIDPYSARDPFGRNRWAVDGKKDYYLPWDVRFKSDFAFISDNEYLSDFNDLDEDDDDRFLVSNAFLQRSFSETGRFGARAEAVYSDDLQNPDDVDRDKFLLQRLPTLTGSVLPAALSDSIPVLDRIVPSFDSQYTFFHPIRSAFDQFSDLDDRYLVAGQFVDTGIDAIPTQNERGFPGNSDPHRDDNIAATPGGSVTPGGPELNGKFDEGEPIAEGGHRIELFPRVAAPFRIGDYVEAYPEVGWHQTLYHTDRLGTDERHLLTTRLDLRTRIVRRFLSGLTHLIEPRLSYVYLDDLGSDQSDNPIFVPETAVPQQRIRQIDLTNVIVDDADRVSRVNALTYGVSNRFYSKTEHGPRLVADIYLSNQVRFGSTEVQPIYLGGTAYPLEELAIWTNFGFDPERVVVSEATAELAWLAEAGHEVRLRYRYLRNTPKFFEDFRNSSDRFENFETAVNRINQISLFTRLQLSSQWALYYTGAYTIEDSLMLQNRGGVEYVSKCNCWVGGFEVGYSRSRGLRFNLIYRIRGLGDDFERRSRASLGSGDLGALDSL